MKAKKGINKEAKGRTLAILTPFLFIYPVALL
jgi:hypothetical protein